MHHSRVQIVGRSGGWSTGAFYERGWLTVYVEQEVALLGAMLHQIFALEYQRLRVAARSWSYV